jgi:hypothetical protein
MPQLLIRDLARVAARAVAVEETLVEAFGRWIGTTTDPTVPPLLAAAARRHAWHAELWRDRFPAIPGADIEEAVASERARLGALDETLAAFDDPTWAQARVALAALVADRLRERYAQARATIDPLLDAPTARVLDLVVNDPAPAATTGSTLSDDERAALERFERVAPIPDLEVT